MKFKKAKNKKTKLHIRFNQDDRKEYLLGFRKRKLERKEKAKEQMAEQFKKQKQEIKRKRIDFIQKMIEERTTLFDNDSGDEEKEDDQEGVVTDYDNCTVEVSDLNLQNKGFLGMKKIKSNPKPSGSDSLKGETSSKTSLKLPLSNKISNKKIKTSIWKTASRKAKKSFDQEKRDKKKKKKKVLVTSL